MSRNTKSAGFAIIIVVGAIFIAIGVLIHIGNEAFFKKAVPTDAVIVDIVTKTKKTGTGSKKKRKITHEVYVSYTFEEQEYYNIKINQYSSAMTEGETITLYCDPDNPTDIRHKETSDSVSKIMIVLGAMFSVIGVIVFITSKKNNR